MNKKEYQKPSFKEFELESIQLLAGSAETTDEQTGGSEQTGGGF